ncbi:MAG TPA: twin-arginine translocase TatA/TatE family subunit [Candidatus Eremiobacteraceae bacterium]|nr:twin-arginine translocase TatA/TatE family subunit [Candidatus Eremiobacteraceae bacterium]
MTLTFAVLGLGPDILIVVGLVVILFGAERIPKLARSMGEAKKEFEAAQRPTMPAPPAQSEAPPPPQATTPPAPPPAAPQS